MNQNQVRGAKAKASGKLFEEILSHHCRSNKIKFEQLPSGCRWIGKTAIPVKTPFDFIMAKNGKVVLFDAKSLDSSTFSRSACKPHQIESLYGFELSGLTAGFIVWLREIDEIVFFRASLLNGLASRCSLKPCDGIPLGNRSALTVESLFND